MKIIQITDTHYGYKGELIYGREPAFFMQLAIQSINREHKDAKFCILTGDVTNKGTIESYEYLKSDLDKLCMPYYVLLGNHDERKNALKILPHLESDSNGFVQYAIKCDNAIFLMLDTLQAEGEVKTHGGFFCKKRQEWLINQLQIYHDKEIYVCLHHAPFNTGIVSMDSMRLRLEDSIKLYEILQTHTNIRHLFFGHYHSTLAGKWGNISFSSLKGINHQVKLDFNDKDNVWMEFRNPEYSVILIDEKMKEEPPTLCVHFRDFMFHDKHCIKEPIAF